MHNLNDDYSLFGKEGCIKSILSSSIRSTRNTVRSRGYIVVFGERNNVL